MNLHIKVSGTLFTPRAKDLVEDAIGDAVREIVAEGETIAKEKAVEVVYSKGGAHPDKYRPTGRWLNSIHGDMQGPMKGTIDDSRLVYGPWLEGVSSRNDQTRFKGYATFRHTMGQLEKKADDIAEKHIRRAIARLN